MTDVALFRNLNLGHPGSPTRQELLAAFGGASSASVFQTNGTVVFAGPSKEPLLQQAIGALRAAGYTQHVIVRSLGDIQRIIEHVADPDPAENVYRTMVSFFDAPALHTVRLPLRSPDRLVEVRTLDATMAVSVCWKPESKAGDVTGFIESLVHAPVTTRTLGTLRRLLDCAQRASS